MAKPTARIAAIQFGFALGIAGGADPGGAAPDRRGRALGAARRARQRTEKVVLPARRGALYDRNGVPLAITQEFYHVGVAPNELDDVRAAFVLLVAEPRRVGAGAQPGVPGAEALDLPPRPLQRDAGRSRSGR